MLPRTQSQPLPPPPANPGCERVHRFWDREYRRWSARILPGEIFVTRHDEIITAVVESCIAVCVRDPVLRIGGMCLFMLPVNADDEAAALHRETVQPDVHELSRLVDELLKLDVSRDRLKVKLFGGGRSILGEASTGAKTSAFVRNFLRQEGLPVVAEKLGDTHPRLVIYSPSSGMAQVKRLPSRYAAAVATREMQYFSGALSMPAASASALAS